jgi:hypothetical protein
MVEALPVPAQPLPGTLSSGLLFFWYISEKKKQKACSSVPCLVEVTFKPVLKVYLVEEAALPA